MTNEELKGMRFIPYHVFANDTIGLIFECKTNGKTYTRIEVWSREYDNKDELIRVMGGRSTTYKAYDKPGWKNGRLLNEYA